jgi:hypothetical protein
MSKPPSISTIRSFRYLWFQATRMTQPRPQFRVPTAWYISSRTIKVFDGHFDHYGHFDRHDSLRTSVYQVRWQRQREQQHHLFTMWCVSRLDFMIISLRAKSEMNYHQKSSQLRWLRKCNFCVFNHMINVFTKHRFVCLVLIPSRYNRISFRR